MSNNTARAAGVLCTLSMAAGVGLSVSAASAATLRALAPGFQGSAVSGPIINFKGRSLRVGWAAPRLHEMQRHLSAPFLLPLHPLYVADPGLNGVAIFNKNGLGQQVPSAFLAGPNTQINGPVAITGGFDEPCTTGVAPSATTCANYLWVANAVTDTITVYGTGIIGQPPLYVANQAPMFVISNPAGGCGNLGLGFQAGIVHRGPRTVPGYTSFSDGYIVETAETANAVETYDAVASLPGAITECQLTAETSIPYLVSPSGPSGRASLLPNIHGTIFNANSNFVTRSHFSDPAWFPLSGADIWSLGTNNNTQGTALDGNNLWVTTAHAGAGAVWYCNIVAAPYPAGCPSTPVAQITGLQYPVFPKAQLGRLFVPDQSLGVVNEYQEASPYTLRAYFINLATPWDVAGVGD